MTRIVVCVEQDGGMATGVASRASTRRGTGCRSGGGSTARGKATALAISRSAHQRHDWSGPQPAPVSPRLAPCRPPSSYPAVVEVPIGTMSMLGSSLWRRDAGAKPRIRIVSRPKKPKTTPVMQAIPVEPGSDADQRLCEPRQKRRRRTNRGIRLSMSPLVREVWGVFPTPLDRARPVPAAVSEWLVSGHRWFKPELVHQTLYNIDGRFESALQYLYQTWMNADYMRRLYADVHEYIAGVSDDVFGIDPDRYIKIRPDQVIQLENPSGFPVFIHQKPAVDLNGFSELATLSVYSDTSSSPSQLKLVMNDAALKLWGYTREQWESHSVHNVEDPLVQDKILPFFFSLFSDPTAFTILALNLAIFYLRCKFAHFTCNIMRRDGKMVRLKECSSHGWY